MDQEIRSYKALGREDRVLCLIVDGEPNGSDKPGGPPECFPESVRFRAGPDGKPSSERAEPIAVDARQGQDGKDNAKLKVLAGLLGVGFDELRQRDAERRRRQRVWVAGGLLAVAGSLSGIWAWQERAKNRQAQASIRELSQQLAFSYAVRAQQFGEKGDAGSAAVYSAQSNMVFPSALAQKNALAWLAEWRKPTRVFAHDDHVQGVAFSPDGKSVLTGGSDARLWDAETGEPIGKVMRHEYPVCAIAFTPDGKSVLTGSDGGPARLWDTAYLAQDTTPERLLLSAEVMSYHRITPRGNIESIPGEEWKALYMKLSSQGP